MRPRVSHSPNQTLHTVPYGMVRVMVSRMAWLDEGLEALATGGVSAVRIDRLAARLGLSKGSFYHHFSSIDGYRRDLLAHYETECTTRYIDKVEVDSQAPADEKFWRLVDLVLADDGGQPALEAAVRTWAGQDEVARRTVQRVDAIRVDYLSNLCADIVGSRQRGSELGQMLYLLLIGAQHAIPPLTEDQLRRLYTRVMDQEVG